MQKNAAAWPYLTGFLRADFALVQDPPPLPENINGLLIHSAQHTGKQSVLYANGTNGYRLRSTMSLAPGGVIASFCKSGQEDLHLLDVHPWTSVTLESAVEMVQELGRANRFLRKETAETSDICRPSGGRRFSVAQTTARFYSKLEQTARQ
jgi:hypothetical protein